MRETKCIYFDESHQRPRDPVIQWTGQPANESIVFRRSCEREIDYGAQTLR